MTTLYVDGDACPVKEAVYAVAARHRVPVVVVANSYFAVPRNLDVKLVVVDRGLDAADDWIAERARPGDLVVTADLPLAGRCLDAGARVLGTTGRELDDASIGDRLATRALKEHLRGAGQVTGGPPPLTDRDRSRFASKLDALVHRLLRDAAASG